MEAGREMTASPQCPKNGNKSAQRSQKQRARQGQAGSQAWLPARRATPLQTIPSGRRQGPGQATALIISELAPASKAHAWTFQIFPLLSLTFPYSLISPRHPPTHTLFLLTLSFHFCSKTNNPGQMCQLASGKGSLQHELCDGYTARGGGAGGAA